MYVQRRANRNNSEIPLPPATGARKQPLSYASGETDCKLAAGFVGGFGNLY